MKLPLHLFLLGVVLGDAGTPPDQWKPFSPKDGAFTISMPGSPKEHKRKITTAAGAADMMLYEVVVPPADGRFIVGYSEFPPGSIKPGTEDKRLDNARNAAVASAKGKLKREKSLVLDTYPGREVQIESEGKAIVVMRMYAINNRLYEIVAAGRADFVTSKDSARFLDSFKLGK